MASAAGPARNLQPLDPFRQARYPVSFAGKKRKSEAYASVQYNHKPQQTSKKRKTTLKPSANDPGRYQLSIRDTNGEESGQELYKYSGESSSAKDVYAVLYDPQTRKCVLAAVDSQYVFNLTSTPKEKNTTKLLKKYDQIKPHDSAGANLDIEDDLFGGGDDQLSDDNSDVGPGLFDWRNFVVRGRSSSPDNTIGNPGRGAVSAQNTPLLSAQGARSSVPSKPKPQPRSQNGLSGPKLRDVLKPRKSAVSPLVTPTRKAAAPAATKKEKKSGAGALPDIRVERRPSTRPPPPTEENAQPPPKDEESRDKRAQKADVHNEEDNDNDNNDDEADDLVLDFESPTEPSKRPRPSAFGLAAAASSGPISLRSAASSPGSRLGSPALRHNRTPTAEEDDDDNMGLEIEVPDAEEGPVTTAAAAGLTSYTFDDGDDDEEQGQEEEYGEEGGDGERGNSNRGSGDSDVDALELPSPAADTRRESEVGKRALSPPDEMDEDEMEAEMMQALASDEDENEEGQDGGAGVGAGIVAQEESESESEEE